MKRALLAVALVGGSSVAIAQAQFFKGNDLHEYAQADALQRAFLSGYVAGVQDAENNRRSFCVPGASVTVEQMRDVVAKYLQENPAIRHRNADVLVVKALADAWPCSKPQ